MPQFQLLSDTVWRVSPDPQGNGEALGFHAPAFDAHRWREVTVPSCFDVACPGLEFYDGVCWYRHAFRTWTDWQGRRVMLRFGAVNYRAKVWLNGVLVGESPDGFLPVEFDVTGVVTHDGENVLVVAVDNTPYPEDVPGPHVGWRRYGGITRDVILYATDVLYLEDPWVVAMPEGDLTYRVRVVNGRATAVETDLEINIYGPDGVCQLLDIVRVALAPGEAREVTVSNWVPGAQPWSPATPVLYTAIAHLGTGEEVPVQFGFRRIEATPGGLLLNGEPIFLTGFNRHEDSPTALMASDDDTVKRDLLAMKQDAGANLVRLCHYPHDPHELDLCDQMGLLVFAEIPLYFWNDMAAGERLNDVRAATARRQLERMITRDRNHPSIIFWSVSNETHDDVPAVAESNRALIRRARELDPTRLCVHVSNHWQDAPNFAEDDVICINGYPSIDWEANGPSDAFREGRSAAVWRAGLETLHAQYPDKPVFISEFGHASLLGTTGHAFGEDIHAQALAMEFPAFDAPYICGATVWCWADHGWDVTRFFHGMVISPFGVLTRDRRRKQPYYVIRDLFRARQGQEPLPRPVSPSPGSIVMIRPDLENIPEARLPEGYRIRPMTLGDAGLWDDIERDAERFFPITDGLFLEQFGSDPEAVPRRCFLVLDPLGIAIGTISAWYCRDFHGEEWGQIHWVALRPSAQGKGLGKAMMTHALRVMAQWHDRAFLITSTERVGAVKRYLDYGFLPDLTDPATRAQWEDLAQKLQHPALLQALQAV
jgi:beta-glucuronidase